MLVNLTATQVLALLSRSAERVCVNILVSGRSNNAVCVVLAVGVGPQESEHAMANKWCGGWTVVECRLCSAFVRKVSRQALFTDKNPFVFSFSGLPPFYSYACYRII